MKRLKVICSLLLGMCTFLSGQAQSAQNESGTLEGAPYIILFPENWDGNLVMYAHGYEFMGSAPRQSGNPEFPERMKPFLDRGFAVAASDYSMQGFAFAEGVRETERLRRYFTETYREPDSTFMVGHSMGGGITLATIENYGDRYHGGLPLCPLSSRPYLQVRKEFDLFAVVNAGFPGIVPSLSEIFGPAASGSPQAATPFPEIMARAAGIREKLIERDSLLATEIAEQYYLTLDELPMTLLFGENVLRDIAQKAGGNPFDNTNTIYSGFPNDLEINQKVERLEATADPADLFSDFDRTGDIGKPVVLMHTLRDQLIPPIYGEVNFENMVTAQGRGGNLTVWYTNGNSHCAFSPEQTGAAFDALRHWVKTGKKAVPGYLD